jgi:hypothetical protein
LETNKKLFSKRSGHGITSQRCNLFRVELKNSKSQISNTKQITMAEIQNFKPSMI